MVVDIHSSDCRNSRSCHKKSRVLNLSLEKKETLFYTVYFQDNLQNQVVRKLLRKPDRMGSAISFQ